MDDESILKIILGGIVCIIVVVLFYQYENQLLVGGVMTAWHKLDVMICVLIVALLVVYVLAIVGTYYLAPYLFWFERFL